MIKFVRRSWGYYITLLDRKHFKVKLLRFKKGGECSLQYHHLRDELWLFLKGNGQFTLIPDSRRPDDPNGVFEAYGDSVIKVGKLAVHKYLAIIPSLVLEIQYGEKCDEEDIVRI